MVQLDTANTYYSRFVSNGIAYDLGNFEGREAAALAHDAAQRKIHRSSAIVNFMTKKKTCEQLNIDLPMIMAMRNSAIDYQEGVEYVESKDKSSSAVSSVTGDDDKDTTPKSKNTAGQSGGGGGSDGEDSTEWRYKKEVRLCGERSDDAVCVQRSSLRC